MVHLLRAGAVVHNLIGRRHRPHVVKGVDSAILIQALGYRLVFGKLVHEHLLVGLLSSEHI